MKNDKITIALLWGAYGGKVTSVNDLVERLDKSRFRVIFIYLTGYGTDENYLQDKGYEVFYLSNIKLINAFRFSILFKLVKILREHKVDILHCHGHKPAFYSAIAATIARTKVVISHVHGLGRTGNFRRKLTNFLVFRKITRFLGVAGKVKEDLLKNNWGLKADKVSVLENSIDYGLFADVDTSKEQAREMLGLCGDSLIFGAVGRLVPTKGVTYLIDAFAAVNAKLPKTRLAFLGDGRNRDEYEAYAADSGVGEAIDFLGRRSEIEKLYRGIDVFVMSSVAEGMPRVILEAMAAGVVCICTDVGGVGEIIDSTDVGFLVPPRDSDGLADAMSRLAQMPEDELARIRENADRRVREKFTHDVVAGKLQQIYEDEFNNG